MSDDAPVDESKRATLRRFAALGAAGSLTKLAGEAAADPDDEGSSEVRDAIRGYLSRTPGAHFSKLRDDLQLGTGEAQHHLRRLLDRGAIESHRDGDYRRFFPADQFSTFEKTALSYLRRSTARGMIVELLADPAATGADLATALDVSRATVSKYAAELESAGLLSRESGYEVERPEAVLVLLVRYADSFDDDARDLADRASSLIDYEG